MKIIKFIALIFSILSIISCSEDKSLRKVKLMKLIYIESTGQYVACDSVVTVFEIDTLYKKGDVYQGDNNINFRVMN